MTTLIMGGTSGIGRAVAERLARQGAAVTVTGRDPEKVAAVDPGVAAAEVVDAADSRALRAFLDGLGAVDHLVLAFSPGAAGLGPVREVTADDVRTAFAGKVIAYLDVIRLAQVTGSITMISASSARSAIPGSAVLAAANGAIERMVPPLAVELAPIRVNAVSPGVVDTGWWSFLDDRTRKAQFDQIAGSIPAGRVASVDDVARVVAFAIGEPYLTGAVLPADGGAAAA